MTKKDYENIARQFRSTVTEVEAETKNGETEIVFSFFDRLASRIATVLQNDNPRFDRQRFLAACNDGREVN